MSDVIGIVATITPKADKVDEVRQALLTLAGKVKETEPDALRYKITEQINAEGTPAFLVVEEYKNQAAIDHHNNTDHFKALGQKFQEGQLLAGFPDVKHTKVIGGYDSK